MPANEQDLIWTGCDSLGNSISLSVSARDHIYAEKPALRDCFTAIYGTVEDPDEIKESTYAADCQIYIKSETDTWYWRKNRMETRVVIRFLPEGHGRIVTAYATKPTGGGNIGNVLYSKNSVV